MAVEVEVKEVVADETEVHDLVELTRSKKNSSHTTFTAL
jgi:hypothetical protein